LHSQSYYLIKIKEKQLYLSLLIVARLNPTYFALLLKQTSIHKNGALALAPWVKGDQRITSWLCLLVSLRYLPCWLVVGSASYGTSIIIKIRTQECKQSLSLELGSGGIALKGNSGCAGWPARVTVMIILIKNKNATPLASRTFACYF
jgi:hypothetical protein